MTADRLPSILEGVLAKRVAPGSIHDSPRALLPLLATFAADLLIE